jgi:hypothetical protein
LIGERATVEISWNMECELKRLLSLAVRASPPQNCKQQLYFKIEHCLTITVPTHKHYKSPFKHLKIIYVFTSGGVVVDVHIDSRKKILNG